MKKTRVFSILKTSFKKMKKKGIAVDELIMLMSVLVIAGILFFAVYQMSDVFGRKGQVETCRLSVLANSQVNEAGGATAQIAVSALGVNRQVPIQCPAPVVEMEGKGLKAQYQEIAEELRSCWYKTGEGNLKVFGADKGEKNYCLVCSLIQTKDRLQVGNVNDYLKSKSMPKKNKTYAGYLKLPEKYDLFVKMGDGAPEPMKSGEFIEAQKEYLVVFLRSSESLFGQFLSAIYDDEDKQSVRIMPKEDLAKSGLCTDLYWQREKGWLDG